MDTALLFYILTAFLSWLGAGFFLYYWYKMKSASWAYIYMTSFLISLGYRHIIDVVGRCLRDNIQTYIAFGDTWLWETRLIPTVIVLFLFNVHIITRLYKRKK